MQVKPYCTEFLNRYVTTTHHAKCDLPSKLQLFSQTQSVLALTFSLSKLVIVHADAVWIYPQYVGVGNSKWLGCSLFLENNQELCTDQKSDWLVILLGLLHESNWITDSRFLCFFKKVCKFPHGINSMTRAIWFPCVQQANILMTCLWYPMSFIMSISCRRERRSLSVAYSNNHISGELLLGSKSKIKCFYSWEVWQLHQRNDPDGNSQSLLYIFCHKHQNLAPHPR